MRWIRNLHWLETVIGYLIVIAVTGQESAALWASSFRFSKAPTDVPFVDPPMTRDFPEASLSKCVGSVP